MGYRVHDEAGALGNRAEEFVMFGIVIVTHGQLADALVNAAQFITGTTLEFIKTVSVDVSGGMDVDKLRSKIAAAIKSVNPAHGVLLLTDMFGGSPSNLSYSFLKNGEIEVLSGVNLPILIKALEIRNKLPLPEAAEEIEKSGKKSISLASKILQGHTRS